MKKTGKGGEIVTQQEKDRLHIQKQKRRFRKLILSTLYPLIGALILASPLLIFGIMMRCATPSEPITVTYSDCRWEGGRHRSLVLYTADGKQWMLTRHLRQNFYQDAKDGLLVPGDRLSITWYPWVLRNAVATLACDGRTYGDLKAGSSRCGRTPMRCSAFLPGCLWQGSPSAR